MKNYIQSLLASFSIAGWLLLGGMLPLSVHAATVDLATVPLANATTTNVLPNLMFILDNSGSMKQDYTPDYISDINNNPVDNDRNCRDSGDDGTYDSNGTVGDVFPGVVSGANRILDLCMVGDVPYMSSDINSQYYNPAIRYTPGVNADGASRGDQTTPTNVRTDSYNQQNTTQLLASANYVDLTTSYPDRVWCTTRTPSNSDLTNTNVCRKNSDYLYPNTTFKYGRTSGLPDRKVTALTLANVIKVTGAPYYYSVVPTEYCSESELVNCVLSSTPTTVAGVSYSFPAKSRWCSDTALTTCKSTRSGTYVYPRYVGVSVNAVAASGRFDVTGATKNANATVTSVTVHDIEIMGGTGTGCGAAVSNSSSGTNSDRYAALATAIANKINSCTSNPEYTATVSGARVVITSTLAAGAAGNGTIVVTGFANGAGVGSINAAAGGVTGSSAPPYTFTRTDIVSTTNSYPKSAARTDCGATCSYVQEMTNFANWYTYYRTRMQAMKTAASLAFKPIDSRYRVGFITIQSTSYLPINKFDAGVGSQKEQWYSKLFGIAPDNGTPLRSALSLVGRIYAGKKPIGSSDPVQYSCQQNFALLTTDGYWNTDTDADVKDVAGTGQVGNKDGGTSVARPMNEGPTASSNSLADVAKYYYDTDLRTTDLSNCTGPLGLDVCENNVFVSGTDNNPKQHMTTFTLGLGIDGTLMYNSDYKTATSGDFYKLKNKLGSPTVYWPVPAKDSESAVDDLWHAAVNGQGTYFSAKDPAQLTKGLTEALSQINAKIGAGAAAATSTLNPVAGDNFAYLASYTTVKWTGNLEKRTINTTTGEVSESAVWSVEDIVNAPCPAPSSIVAEPTSSSSIYYCVTPNASSCPVDGIMDGTSCKVEVKAARLGTMAKTIASGTRRVLMNKSGALADFTYTNMTAVQQSYFQQTYLAPKLSQWTSLDAGTQQPNAKETNLVNFLRGDTTYEDRGTNTPVNRLFRYREAFLGDALESSPVFVGVPVFKYSENNYPSGIDVSRGKTVYIGTNDGMLHAFDADTGEERWAYVPSMVIPNMWKLADKNYATMHAHYVNGDPIVSDVYDGSSWKTILVGGLNGGGKGYYALDITNPDSPILLWEFGNSDCVGCTRMDNNMGYSFGNPVITKTPENKWVVVLTSGYNNGGGSESGKGVLYVLNALTGTSLVPNISTSAGEDVTPSGLAEISAWSDVADAEKENVAHWIYGGDLLGNLWRFDIGATPSSPNPKLVAILRDAQKNGQPITTRPELGKVGENRVVFVGTGKYLEINDLTDKQQQTLYAIKDSDGPTIDNPRNTLVEQTLSAPSNTRTGSANSVDMANGDGWFVNFYVPGASDTTTAAERQNVAGQLVAGTLLVPTTIPSNAVCSPGGYSYFNFFSYDSGKPPNLSTGLVSTKTNAPIVGFNVMYIAGKPVVSAVTADAKFEPVATEFGSGNAKFQSKRAIWRELLD